MTTGGTFRAIADPNGRGGASMEQHPDGQWKHVRDYDALAPRCAEAEKDAARWRWARQDNTLWRGTYNYGVGPDGADEVADFGIASLSDADGVRL